MCQRLNPKLDLMQERELLVMRGYRNVATVRRQYFVYKQAFESQLIQINLSDDGAREGAFGITLREYVACDAVVAALDWVRCCRSN